MSISSLLLIAALTPVQANEQIQQFANNAPVAWQNGNLNSVNSSYVEGDSIPYRYEITGIPNLGAVVFKIHYDFTKGGLHAIDFSTGWDATEGGLINSNGGVFGGTPLTTLTTNQLVLHAVKIPDDPAFSPDNLYTNTHGSQYISIAGFYTNAFVSGGYVLNGATNADSEKVLTIIVQGITNGQVAFFWGGHLAVGSAAQWGLGNGAGAIAGSPFHENGDGFIDSNNNGIQDTGETSLSTANRSMSAGTVTPSVDLSLSKDVDNPTPTVGSNIVYTVWVTNSGPSDGTGIAVQDILPAGVTYVSNGPGTYNSGSGTWSIGALNAGNSTSLTITAKVTALGLITNIAQVLTAGQPDPDSTPGNSVPTEDDQDNAVITSSIAPAVQIVKTAGNAADGSTLYVLSGSNVVYTYRVINSGNSYLINVVVTDNVLGVIGTIPGVVAPGATNFLNRTNFNVTAGVTNIGVVRGTPSLNTGSPIVGATNVTAADDAKLGIVIPAIQIVKTAGNAADGSTLSVLSGSTVVYTYKVVNIGNTYLTNVVVTDSVVGVVGTVPGVVAPGDTNFLFKTNLNVSVSVTNVGVATGSPSLSDGTLIPNVSNVRALDNAIVAVVSPALSIVKTAGNAADGSTLFILPGANVVYTYKVVNIGNTYMTNVVVTDNVVGVVGTIAGVVAPGATNFLFRTNLNVIASITNLGVVVGSPSLSNGALIPGIGNVQASDPAAVATVSPDITIIKTAGNAAEGGTLFVTPDENVIYKYEIVNNGNTTLSSVTVTDNVLGVVGTVPGNMAPGTTNFLFATNNSIQASVTNLGVVVGTPSFADGSPIPGIDDVTDSNDAIVEMVSPDIHLIKLAGDAPDGTPFFVLPNGSVVYTYELINRGDTYLTNVVVTDSVLGVVGTVPGIMAPGTTNFLYATNLNVNTFIQNIGVAVGTPSFSDGSPIPGIDPVHHTDDAIVDVIHPGIQLIKTADNAGDSQVDFVLSGANVIYTYKILNTSTDTYLINITLTDSVLGVIGTVPGIVAPGATNYLFATNFNVISDVVNVGVVVGSPSLSDGTPLPVPAVQDEHQASVDVVHPAIHLVKTADTTAEGGTDYILPGASVPYTYEVINFGDTFLTNVVVTDNVIGVIGTVSGIMAPGETNFLFGTHPNILASVTNLGVVVGLPTDHEGIPLPNIPTVRDTNDAVVAVVIPAIRIVKTAGNAAEGDTLFVLPGSNVVYTYQVANIGDTYLTNVVVTDNVLGVVGTIPGVVAPGATNYLFRTNLNVTVDVTNVGIVDGNPSFASGVPIPGINDVLDTNDAVVTVVSPNISIVKTANGTADGAVDYILSGSNVVYTYKVVNNGGTYLSNVTVTDNVLGAIGTIPGVVAPGATNYLVRTNINVTASVTNLGTVVGTPSFAGGSPIPGISAVHAADDAIVNVVGPSIRLVKTANSTADGAVDYILPGSNVVYTYKVVNNGSTYLSNVVVTDNVLGIVGTIPGVVAPGATNYLFRTNLNVTADVTNRGVVVGTPSFADGSPIPGIGTVLYADDAIVAVRNPTIRLVKTAGNAPDGSTLFILSGSNVVYTYQVVNLGDTYLANVVVTDNVVGVVGTVSGVMAPGATNYLYKTNLNVTADVVNLGVVAGTPSFSDGTPVPGLNPIRSSDNAAVDVVGPAIQLIKLAGDDPDGETHYIISGEDVLYTYDLKNIGDTFLVNVSVTDNVLGVIATNISLAPGQNLSLTTTHSNMLASTTNLAVTVGDPADALGNVLPGVPKVTDQDDAIVVLVHPSVQITKVAGNAPDGQTYFTLSGSNVVYTYTVVNTGDIALRDVVVTDNVLGVIGSIPGFLAPGASTNLYATNLNVTADVTNLAVVVGNPNGLPEGIEDEELDLPLVTDQDDAVVDVVAPSLLITKLAGNAPDGQTESILSGQNVVYTYVVTNTGDTFLGNIVVTDNVLGVVGTIAGPLAPGGVATLFKTNLNVTADVTNIGVADGNPVSPAGADLPNIANVRDDDNALVDVVGPAIRIVKLAGNAADGATEFILSGSNVVYTYQVVNIGDTYLNNITVTDNVLGVVGTIPGNVAPGATNYLYKTNLNVTADVTNIGVADGNPTDSGGSDLPDIANVRDDDTAIVDVVGPAILIVKTADSTADGATDFILSGQNVVYKYKVVNIGDTYLNNITVTDSVLGVVGTIPGNVAPGVTNFLFKTNLNVIADVTNIGVADGNPTDSSTNDLPDIANVRDDDTAIVDVVGPAIQVVKLAGNAADGTTEYILSGQNVVYTYKVVNIGDTFLNNITVTDNVLGVVGTIPGNVAPGATNFLFKTNLNVIADVTNIGVADGNPTDGGGNDLANIANVRDDDNALVDVVGPAIQVVKLAGNAADGTTEYILSGQNVVYTYKVVNIGDTYLNNITVTDSVLGVVGTIPGNVAPGATNFLFKTNLNVIADVTNVGVADGNPTDSNTNDLPDIANVRDDDNAIVDVVGPAILIVKTADSTADGATDFILSGQNVVYKYKVVNIGDTYLNNITVTDSVVGVVGTIPGNVAPGVTNFLFKTNLNVTADVTNIGVADGNPTDSGGSDLPDIANVRDDDTAIVDVVHPGVKLVKTTDSCADGSIMLVLSGTQVVYTYQVINTGDTYIAGIVVTDNVFGAVGVNTNSLAPAGSVFFYTTNTISASVTNLAVARAQASDLGGTPLGVSALAGSDSAIVQVVSPAIQLTKLVANAPHGQIKFVQPGNNVVYTYIVANTGDTPLYNIFLSDDVLGTIVPNFSLLPGQTNVYLATNLNVTVGVTNIATACGSPDPSVFPRRANGVLQYCYGEFPDVCSSDTGVVAIAYLKIEKEDLPDPVHAGQPLTYTLWIGNPSPNAALNVVVTEQYPPGFSFVTSVPTPSSGNNVWNLGTLNPGQVVPIVIDGVVSAGLSNGTVLTNVAIVTSSNAGSNNVPETTLVVTNPGPGKTLIEITKHDNVDPVAPGGTLVYTLRVENFGPLTASNVVVSDTYDPFFTFSGSGPAPSSGNNVWSLGNMAANTFREIVVTGTVSAAAPNGYIVVDTTVATASNAPPSQDDEVTLVVDQPPPHIIKTDSQDPILAGHTLIYTITVQNVSVSLTVSNVTVVESYDPNFLFVSSVPSPLAGTSNTWFLGDMAPGAVDTIVITGTVSTNSQAQDVLFNTAEVFSDSGSLTVHETTQVLQPATIGGRMWEDFDLDGYYDGESPDDTIGQPVELYSNGVLIASTVIGADNTYQFTDLWPGVNIQYHLKFFAPAVPLHFFIKPLPDIVAPGTNYQFGSDASTNAANYGETTNTTLAPGQVDLTWYAGIVEPGIIGRYVWVDLNNNGIPDENLVIEGINGATVNLYLISGGTTSFVSSAVTATGGSGRGFYQFTNLPPATYLVMVDTNTIPPTLSAKTTPMSYQVNVGYDTVFPDANFGFNGSPTPVELKSLTAARVNGGVRIAWETTVETDNLGFNVYRATSQNGIKMRINEDMVLANGESLGQAYALFDSSAGPESTWFYWLEDVSLAGETKLHGPAVVRSDSASAPTPDGESRLLVSVSLTNETAVFRVTYEAMVAAGMSVGDIDPSRLQVMVDGQEVAAFVKAGNLMKPGDFILFFATSTNATKAVELRAGNQGKRMDQIYASPSDGDGDVWTGTVDVNGLMYFMTDSTYVRYLLTGFGHEPVYVLDVTDWTQPKLLFGHAQLSQNTETGVYMSYFRDDPGLCIAVGRSALVDVNLAH